jgi:hypothetical protein
MKNSWRHYFRRLATVCVVSGSMAWSSAVCYAVQLAFDSAADVVYDNGWQAGDNGGFGFGAWNFDGTYNTAIQQAIDDGLKAGTQTSTAFNDLGRAWTMYNPVGRPVGPSNGAVGTDIARAGRRIPTLQVGHTVTVVLDNPVERFFFRGYNVKLNTYGGNSLGGNTCNGFTCTPGQSPEPSTLTGIGTFEYGTDGLWGDTSLFDTDTDAGVRIAFTLTAANAYSLTMTPLDNPSAEFTKSDTLEASGTINWIEFQFYNTDSDYYPAMVSGARATDYYIRSIEVTGSAPPGVPGDYNGNGQVDASDYVLWRNGGPLQNEVDAAGHVDLADYTAWRARFGNTSGAGTAQLGSAVPEPGAFVLFVAGASGVISLGLRRRPMSRQG